MGFIKQAIPRDYVFQYWCLFPEMNGCVIYLQGYKGLVSCMASPIGILKDGIYALSLLLLTSLPRPMTLGYGN